MLASPLVSGCIFNDADPEPGPGNTYDAGVGDSARSDGNNGDGSSGAPTVSGPLPVDDLVAEMSAQSYGPDVRVYASLRHDKYPGDLNPDDVILTDGDTLTARIGDNGTPVTMDRESDTPGYTVRYMAILPQPTTAAKFDVIIAFNRTNGKDGAPYSKTTLSAPYQITSTPPATVKHGTPLSIQVSSAFDTGVASTNLEITGDCIQHYIQPQAFTGASTTFDTTQIQYFSDTTPAPEGCDIDVRVRAESNGQVDSAFQRGAFGEIGGMPGLQAREFVTHLVP